MRSNAALFHGHHGSCLTPYVLAGMMVLATTVQAAYQDAAGMVDSETAGAERWRASLIASPFGSVHAAQVALPYDADTTRSEAAFGVTMDPLARPTATLAVASMSAARTADLGPDVEYAGAVAVAASVATVFPASVGETKGDLMMSRAGGAERLRVDPVTGDLVRLPRLVIEPPSEAEKPLINSFLKYDPPKNGKPVMVASLDPTAGLNNLIAFQPLLTSPLEEVWGSRIEIDDFERDRHCLATAVYFEARGESEPGQKAVAQVVLNRVLDYRYPDTVCGVVFQNQTWRNRCQFSFACDGRPERITDQGSWKTAVEIAEEALNGDFFMKDIGEATHYHATYVRPRWSRYLDEVEKIGTHVFYQLKPGQR